MKVLMSGPIRPDVYSVLEVIRSVKRQFHPTLFFLTTWEGQLTDDIRKEVDHSFEIPEPSNEFILRNVVSRTRQQRELYGQLETWTFSMYKMVKGVQEVCKIARQYCHDDDLVIRIRTDSIFSFHSSYIQTMCNEAKHKYVVRNRKTSGVGFDDWFAITTFKALSDAWTFDDYNKSVEAAWNAEDLIYSNIKKKRIPVFFMDDSQLECYILRPNGQRNYHS